MFYCRQGRGRVGYWQQRNSVLNRGIGHISPISLGGARSSEGVDASKSTGWEFYAGRGRALDHYEHMIM